MAAPAAIAPAADPSVTTVPTSTPTFAPDQNVTGDDFDYLDTPDDSMKVDPMEFREETEERERKAAEAAKDAADATTVEAEVETVVETPTVEAPSEEAPAPDVQELTAKAEQYDFFDQQIREAPEALAAALIEKMDARQKAAILGQLGYAPERGSFDAETYEPIDELGSALKERWQDIDAIPHLTKQTQAIGQQLEQHQAKITPQVAYGNVVAEHAHAKIDAIAAILEVAFPDLDMKAVEKALGQQGATYKGSVRKVADYAKIVEAGKQRFVTRPKTPGNDSRKPEAIPEGTDAVTIARRLGTIR